MTQRLQKLIAERGICSRRKAEELILQGKVTCNGKVAALGERADPDVDEIMVDGKLLPSAAEHVYIMLHKPRGYVTTLSDEKGRNNAAQLVNCVCRVYPVGRLDMDSEGLLIFTNDGEFAHQLMHPKHEVEKTYRVTVRGFCRENFERLGREVELDGYTIRKPKVSVLKGTETDDRAVLLVTIHEGRNRQVRRMCDLAGMTVLRLVRIREGKLELGDLPRGKWRYLTKDEVLALK